MGLMTSVVMPDAFHKDNAGAPGGFPGTPA